MNRMGSAQINWWIFGLVILGVIFAWTPYGFGQKISSFSADLIMLNPKGSVEQQAKIYVTPSKIRMDRVWPTSGAKIVIIFRRDRNVRWMLNSANKTYLMQPLNEGEMGTFDRKHITARSEKALGTQMVSGITCSIKRVDTTASFRGVIKKIPITTWVSPNLDIPVRTQLNDGSISELRNVIAGPPPEGLFDLPQGYQRVTKMKELRDGQMTRQPKLPVAK